VIATTRYAASREDVEALLKAAGSPRSRSGIRGRALILLLWTTGARISEALAMRRIDLDGLGDPTNLKPTVRLWRAKKAPQGRPRTEERAIEEWEAQRLIDNAARIQELRDLAAAGDPVAKGDIALIELSAIQRDRTPEDTVDRGGIESGIRLRGEFAGQAADALRRWSRERAKMPGGRDPLAPLWVTARASNNPIGDGPRTRAGSLLRPNTLRTWLARRGELAGLGEKVRRIEGPGKRFHPHNLRHGAAEREWTKSRDVVEVNALLGHRWIGGTCHYVSELKGPRLGR
jgi:integrase